MKDGIHPNYKKQVIKCVCGNEIETGSVGENITVEICNNCHPFYTGQQKFWTLKVELKDLTNVTAKSHKFIFVTKALNNATPQKVWYYFF